MNYNYWLDAYKNEKKPKDKWDLNPIYTYQYVEKEVLAGEKIEYNSYIYKFARKRILPGSLEVSYKFQETVTLLLSRVWLAGGHSFLSVADEYNMNYEDGKLSIIWRDGYVPISDIIVSYEYNIECCG